MAPTRSDVLDFYLAVAIGTHSDGLSFRRNKQVTQRITPHRTKERLQLITPSRHESTPNRESKIAFLHILVCIPEIYAQIFEKSQEP